ncbi:MAG: hypothetical protein N3A38_16995, partial [Planctomycetota bacterium]|nr:hypothetical protein [Planctomycetota bacterium]
MTLADIEKVTGAYAEQRARLAELVAELEGEIAALKRRRMPAIRAAAEEAARRREAVEEAVAAAPDLFVRPRSLIIRGIRVGFEKGRGRIEVPDPEATIKRIKQRYPDEWVLYVHVRETPNKDALRSLPADELRRLGVHIEDAADRIVVRATDSE